MKSTLYHRSQALKFALIDYSKRYQKHPLIEGQSIIETEALWRQMAVESECTVNSVPYITTGFHRLMSARGSYLVAAKGGEPVGFFVPAIGGMLASNGGNFAHFMVVYNEFLSGRPFRLVNDPFRIKKLPNE